MKTTNKKKERLTWVGYYERKTKTKREKELSLERKHKKDYRYDM